MGIKAFNFIKKNTTDIKKATVSENCIAEKRVFLNLLSMYDGFSFEYDYINDTMFFSDSIKKHFSCDTIINDFKNFISNDNDGESLCNIKNTGFIDPELFNQSNSLTVKAQIKANDDEYHWYSANIVPVVVDGAVRAAVGVASAINDMESENIKHAQNKDAIDALTLLKAKRKTEALIRDEFKSEDYDSAYLLFDIDSFEKINETFGKDESDSLLVDFANLLKDSFRVTDIVGRMDGDGFCVLMKRVKDIDLLGEKIQSILFDVGKILLPDNKTKLSCCVGGVYFRKGIIITYEELLNEASQNLYKSKLCRKNSFTITEIR
ncbi:MAG: GGDEF domain-containing protein [Oscillospiraceae bacterium]